MTNQNNAAQAGSENDIAQRLRDQAGQYEQDPGYMVDAALNRAAADEIERLRREVSKLRAPVADEPPGGTRWPVLRAMARNYTAGKHTWDALDAEACEQAAEEIRHLRAALESAPVAPAEVMDALNWVDDFIARCNRDDRGSCESVNVLRRALASAPVAGEAQPVADAAIKAAYVEHFGHAAGWLSYKGSWFIEGYRAGRNAAPQASTVAGEAVYTISVKGVFHNWKPTTAAFSIPDGEHQLFLSPAAPQASAEDAQAPADVAQLVAFIFDRFGQPGDAGALPDNVAAAVRRLERGIKAQGGKDGDQQRAADASAPDTAKDRVDKILRERMAPISEALGLDVMLASAGNGVIRIFTFKGGPLVYTIRADGTAILRVSWNQPDAPDTLTVDQVKIITQAMSETQPQPQPARAAVAGEVVGWAAVPSRGKRAGRIYCTCDTREQIDAYIEQVHQSDDSLTLWARPVSFADAAPQASAENVRDVNAAMAAEYRQWIDWFHKGRDYNSFLNECVFNKPQDNKEPA